MNGAAVPAALTVLGLSFLVGGLLLARHTRACGVLLSLGGATAIASGGLTASGHPDAASFVFTATAALLLPLVVALYPRADWRHAADFVTLATVAGAGAITALQWSNPTVTGTLGVVIGLSLVAHTWWRIERGSPSDRGALLWLTLGVGAPVLASGVVLFVAPTTAGATVATTMFLVVAPALYVGVAQPEVVDVRALTVRGVVFSLTSVVYVAGFITLASLLEILSGDVPAVGLLAMVGLAVAAVFHPLRLRLRGVVDELLFGHRPDPLKAASDVTSSIGDDPVLALRAIRQALVLPYAALSMDGAMVAVSGSAVTHTRRLPLAMGEGRLGELIIGLRAGDLAPSSGDEQVLQLLAPLLAQTMRARRLAMDLQVSREQTISALEEERRRLRRDLHDGVGPRLTGIAFIADAARNSLPADPDGTNALLLSLRAEAVAAIEEIRRLVYAMRPPALDELGLIPALRQQAAALRAADGHPLRVNFRVDALPAGVAAAVEVAAYRIVMEALTNVARHSGCDTATVRVRCGENALIIDVEDAGQSQSGWSTGVGLASMRERAAQLGGTLTTDTSPAGARVQAVLPLP